MATTINHEDTFAEIEIGTDDYSDTDGSSIADSGTTSLAESVFDYIYAHGRRYASARFAQDGAAYPLPNDDEEQERMDFQHHMFLKLLSGKLFLAPLEKMEKDDRLEKALDLGTGTGIWAIDFADKFPNCELIATDISPIQPCYIPPNCKFEIDDFTQEWVFPHKFDYIHFRYLTGSVVDWDSLFKKCYENLNPGGYLEYLEFDVTGAKSSDGTYEKSAVATFSKHLATAGQKMGVRFDQVPTYPEHVQKAGFVDVHERKYALPIGTWPKDARFKEIGLIAAEASINGVEAYGLRAFSEGLGMDEREARQLFEDVKKAFRDRRVHAVYTVHVLTARKPFDGEASGEESGGESPKTDA